jgi:transposase
MKFEIALQALKNEKPINEICKRYDVSPSQVHAWKKQLQEQGAQIFSKTDKLANQTEQTEQEKRILYEKIGELTVERDFLKKSWSKLRGNNGDN